MAAAGWIYFDEECGFCAGIRRRWGGIFERRGFVWVPLQELGAAARLGVPESALRAEMWLLLPEGARFGGAEAWGALMRRVWWLWPMGFALSLPGFRSVGRFVYGWVARNRSCLSG